MSSGRKLFAALGAAIVVAALGAAPAAAQPGLDGPVAAELAGPGQIPRVRSELAAQRGGIGKLPLIRAKGTKKHNIYVEGHGNVVLIAVAKRPVLATYLTEGKGKLNHIRARFGRYGRVNMRFEKKGKVRKRIPKGCTGKPDRIQPGVWTGKLKFKGDKRYTKANIKKTKGMHVKWGNYTCPDPGGPFPDLFLGVDSFVSNSYTTFQATRSTTTNRRPYFHAGQDETVGKVLVYRSADVRGDVSQFQYSLSPDEASVEPPAPFSGQGFFAEGDWTGDLAVTVAGKTIPLTGDDFVVSFGTF